MFNSYKFRIYPTAEQEVLINKTFGCTRFVFNHSLELKKEAYANDQKVPTKTDLINLLPSLKKEYLWLKEVDSTALQAVNVDLDDAYKRFFKKQNKFPCFKAKHSSRKSYRSVNNNNSIRLAKNKIRLPKLGFIKARIHRKVKGTIQSATISQTPTGKYYVSVLTKNVQFKSLEPNENQVGLDLGLNHFLISSTGKKIANPKFLKNPLEKLAFEQRALSRKKRFSKNWHKQKEKISKLHEKIKNQRKDFLHKLSRSLIENNDLIVVETLKVANMLKNNKLSQAISDVSWSKFVEFLTYKAKRFERKLIKIDQWFPSSKTCNNCQHKLKNLKLNIRRWKCPECGASHDRDINAAKNILVEGKRMLALT